jgi:hypothetical protein
MFRGRCLIGAKSECPSSLSAGRACSADLYNVPRALSVGIWRIVLALLQFIRSDDGRDGYENFHNSNVAASLLILFHCSGKEADYKSRVSFQKVLTSCLQLLST